MSVVENDKKSGKKVGYVFDQFTHPEVSQFVQFISELGPPDFLINTCSDQAAIDRRYKAKNEVEEINED